MTKDLFYQRYGSLSNFIKNIPSFTSNYNEFKTMVTQMQEDKNKMFRFIFNLKTSKYAAPRLISDPKTRRLFASLTKNKNIGKKRDLDKEFDKVDTATKTVAVLGSVALLTKATTVAGAVTAIMMVPYVFVAEMTAVLGWYGGRMLRGEDARIAEAFQIKFKEEYKNQQDETRHREAGLTYKNRKFREAAKKYQDKVKKAMIKKAPSVKQAVLGVSSVKETFSIMKYLGEFFNKIWKKIKELFNTIISTISSIYNKIVSKISNMFSSSIMEQTEVTQISKILKNILIIFGISLITSVGSFLLFKTIYKQASAEKDANAAYIKAKYIQNKFSYIMEQEDNNESFIHKLLLGVIWPFDKITSSIYSTIDKFKTGGLSKFEYFLGFLMAGGMYMSVSAIVTLVTLPIILNKNLS